MSIADTRLALTQARIDLRNAVKDLELTKALAEQRAIEAAGGEKSLGSNAETRQRALVVALSKDEVYRQDAKREAELRAQAELLESTLENLCDERREYEWMIRAKTADALLDLAGQRTDGDQNVEVTDAVTDRVLSGNGHAIDKELGW